MVFNVGFQDFQSGTSNRTQKEAATPKSPSMLPVIDLPESIENRCRGFALKRSDHIAQDDCGRISQQKVDVVAISVDFDDFAVAFSGQFSQDGEKKVSPLER